MKNFLLGISLVAIAQNGVAREFDLREGAPTLRLEEMFALEDMKNFSYLQIEMASISKECVDAQFLPTIQSIEIEFLRLLKAFRRTQSACAYGFLSAETLNHCNQLNDLSKKEMVSFADGYMESRLNYLSRKLQAKKAKQAEKEAAQAQETRHADTAA